MVCPFVGESEFPKPVERYPISSLNIKSIYSPHCKISEPPVALSSKANNFKAKEKSGRGGFSASYISGKKPAADEGQSENADSSLIPPFSKPKKKVFLHTIFPAKTLAYHRFQL
jgi:hypothetical protein